MIFQLVFVEKQVTFFQVIELNPFILNPSSLEKVEKNSPKQSPNI